MNEKFRIAARSASDSVVMYAHTAPSLRVPVTPANRTLLRRLRAEELSEWEAGCPCLRPAVPAKPAPSALDRL